MKKVFLMSVLSLGLGLPVARADVGLRHISCFVDPAHSVWTFEGPYYVVSQDSSQTVLRDILQIENGRCVLSAPMTLPESWCPFVAVDALPNQPCVP